MAIIHPDPCNDDSSTGGLPPVHNHYSFRKETTNRYLLKTVEALHFYKWQYIMYQYCVMMMTLTIWLLHMSSSKFCASPVSKSTLKKYFTLILSLDTKSWVLSKKMTMTLILSRWKVDTGSVMWRCLRRLRSEAGYEIPPLQLSMSYYTILYLCYEILNY